MLPPDILPRYLCKLGMYPFWGEGYAQQGFRDHLHLVGMHNEFCRSQSPRTCLSCYKYSQFDSLAQVRVVFGCVCVCLRADRVGLGVLILRLSWAKYELTRRVLSGRKGRASGIFKPRDVACSIALFTERIVAIIWCSLNEGHFCWILKGV